MTNDGSPIIQIVEYGSTVKNKFSSYDITSSLFKWNNKNRQIIANVTDFYARKAGLEIPIPDSADLQSVPVTMSKQNKSINTKATLKKELLLLFDKEFNFPDSADLQSVPTNESSFIESHLGNINAKKGFNIFKAIIDGSARAKSIDGLANSIGGTETIKNGADVVKGTTDLINDFQSIPKE